jgi:hypothetical protein
MSANTFGCGPAGWVLDAPDNDVERICTRCEAEYGDIFLRLGTAIGLMEKRADFDALVLLQKYMVLAVNDITDYIKRNAVEVSETVQ